MKRVILRRMEWSTLSKPIERSSKTKTEKVSIVYVLMKATGDISACCAVE